MSYAGNSTTCIDGGQRIKWSGNKPTPDDDTGNTGLIVGIAVGAVVVVGAVGVGIWWWRKKKSGRQPLAEESM